MEPTEELFDTENDPPELKDLANDPEYSADLEFMRATYDKELGFWKENVKKNSDYERYIILFDRNVPLESKVDFIPVK